jgi:hypothetical protein
MLLPMGNNEIAADETGPSRYQNFSHSFFPLFSVGVMSSSQNRVFWLSVPKYYPQAGGKKRIN